MSISQNSIPIVVGETYRYEFYYFASPVTGTLAGSITCGGVTLVNVTNQQFGRAEGTFVATNTNGFVYTVTGSVGTLKTLLLDNVFILGTGASTFGGGIVAGVLNINNTTISKNGRLSYVGSARKQWTKYTANTVTLTAGTSADTVADLRTMTDGLFYTVVETATTPGIDLIVDFINVTAFEKCRVLAGYEGAGTHALALQLYNWTTSAWDTFNAMQTGTYDITTANGYILENYEFTVYDDTNYIGTAGNLGKTRVRFYHTMTGNPAHDLHIDEVSLRQ
jgi:hypothetical protein